MNIAAILFSPNGTVSGRPYWIACALLILAELAIMLSSYAVILRGDSLQSLMMGSMFSVLLWLLIYPYFCVYGKRLRDVGASAWFFLLILLVYAIVSWIAQMLIMMPVMMGEDGIMTQQMGNMEEMMRTQNGDAPPDFSKMMDAQMQMQKEIMKKVFLPNMIAGIVISAVFSGILGVIKTKRENNPYRDFDVSTFN